MKNLTGFSGAAGIPLKTLSDIQAIEAQQEADFLHKENWHRSKKHARAMSTDKRPSEAFYERFPTAFNSSLSFKRALLKWLRNQKVYKFQYNEKTMSYPVVRGYVCNYESVYNRVSFIPYPLNPHLPIIGMPFTSFKEVFDKAYGKIGTIAALKGIGQGVLWDYAESAKRLLTQNTTL